MVDVPGDEGDEEDVVEEMRRALARNGLVRTRDGRLVGGVCAGLGARLGLDPWPARLLFLLVLMLLPGSQLIVYPVLWALLPRDDRPELTPGGWGPPPPPLH